MRQDINQAVTELAQSGVVCYDWMRGQKEYFIAKVWLNFDNLSEAYLYIGRKPKSMHIEAVLLQLRELSVSLSEQWALEQVETINRKRSVGSALPYDESERADLLRAILSLPELGDCTECIEYMQTNKVRLEQEAMLT